MEVQPLSSKIESLWAGRIDIVKHTLPQLRHVDDELIQLALISAHRDDVEEYADAGNRDILAPNGTAAITTCIRSARLKTSKNHGKQQAYVKLQSNITLAEIVHKSPLKYCITPSIRQGGSRSVPYLPASVAAKTVRALIGALILSNNQPFRVDSDVVSPVLDCLIEYLHDEGYGDAQDLCLVSTSSESPKDEFSTSSSYSHQFVDREEMECLGIDLRQIENRSVTTKRLVEQLAGMSLAHTSLKGTQMFEVVSPKPVVIGSQDSQSVAKSSTAGDVSQSSRSITARARVRKGVDTASYKEYFSTQIALITSLGGFSSVRGIVTPHPSQIKLSHSEKNDQTLLKLWYGSVSCQAVIHIKHALSYGPALIRNSRPDVLNISPNSLFEMTQEHDCTHAATSIRRLFHTHELYILTRGGQKADYDDGFATDVTSPGSKRPRGNPLLKTVSSSRIEMARAIFPDFDWKSYEEQEKLKTEISKLEKTGVRLNKLVEEFGRGILCLLSHHRSTNDAKKMFFITESEFSTIPKSDLDEFTQMVKACNHPLVSFAHQATACFDAILNEDELQRPLFQCEEMTNSGLMQLPDGSAQLCAQLEQCERYAACHRIHSITPQHFTNYPYGHD